MAYKHHIPQGNPCAKCGMYSNQHQVTHRPDGSPCKKCKFPDVNHTSDFTADGHRHYQHVKRAKTRSEIAPSFSVAGPRHKPKGDPCSICSLPAYIHSRKVTNPKPNANIKEPCRKVSPLEKIQAVKKKSHLFIKWPNRPDVENMDKCAKCGEIPSNHYTLDQLNKRRYG